MATYKRHTIQSTGGPLADTFGPVSSETFLDTLTIHFSSAPTTAGYFSLTLDSVDGAAYDTVLYRIDPSVTATTDVFANNLGLLLVPGDALRTTYANADARTIGVTCGMR